MYSRLPEHLLGSFLLGRKDDVANFAIIAGLNAMAIEFLDGHTLAISVIALLPRCFGLAHRHASNQVSRWIIGAQGGHINERC